MKAEPTVEIERLESLAGHIRLLSGRLCLDFVNTVEYRGTDHEVDLLVSYKALINWSNHAGAISQDEAAYFLSKTDTPQAESILGQACRLRSVIYPLFAAGAHEQAMPSTVLVEFNAVLKTAFAHRQIAARPDGHEWIWDSRQTPELIIWSLAYSAAELLTSRELVRVRQCPGCGWLFLDESRNRNRTWCDMRICGNRAKAQRHYRRLKSGYTTT